MIVVLHDTAHQVCSVRGNQGTTASRTSTIVALDDWLRAPSSSLARSTSGPRAGTRKSSTRQVCASPMNGQVQTRAAGQVLVKLCDDTDEGLTRQSHPTNVAASEVYNLRTLGNPYLRSNSLCQVGNRGHLSPKINKRKIIARK